MSFVQTCEMGIHDEVNEELASLKESYGLDVQLGYDGQLLLGRMPALG